MYVCCFELLFGFVLFVLCLLYLGVVVDELWLQVWRICCVLLL